MKEGTRIEKTLSENQNFPVKVEGKIYWISRAMAVVGYVFKEVDGKLFVLTEKRGKGAADYVGHFCVPCGYLDFNETLEDAVLRELKEETGFIGDKKKLILLKVNSDPAENRQNVSAHFGYFADDKEDFSLEKAIGGEKDEIELVNWMYIGKITGLKWWEKIFKKDKRKTLTSDFDWFYSHKWAFNHHLRLDNYLSKFYKVKI
ncbi:MAG: protein of unknown function DUF4916 [Bacteriophage sp.]|jgi:ADP-ribose pyrophosphatase YjhB (NUDIX family)|nr:MAG: protein of unknown function DUF4916 [Bacteriophage sp.]